MRSRQYAKLHSLLLKLCQAPLKLCQARFLLTGELSWPTFECQPPLDARSRVLSLCGRAPRCSARFSLPSIPYVSARRPWTSPRPLWTSPRPESSRRRDVSLGPY